MSVIYYCKMQIVDLKLCEQTKFVLGQIAAYEDIIKMFEGEIE